MFEKFTEKARRVVFFARYEASQFGSATIDTEHLLLGVMRESKALGGILPSSVSADTIRKQIEDQKKIREKIPTSVDLPFSTASKEALHSADDEARKLRQPHIHPEHILLGLLRQEDCLATKVLIGLGLQLSSVREDLRRSMALFPDIEPSYEVFINDEFRRVLAYAVEEAKALSHNRIGAEHLLLGMLREEKSLAAEILRDHGLQISHLRERLQGNP